MQTNIYETNKHVRGKEKRKSREWSVNKRDKPTKHCLGHSRPSTS